MHTILKSITAIYAKFRYLRFDVTHQCSQCHIQIFIGIKLCTLDMQFGDKQD
jgi:hypothetical protein